MGAYGHVRWLLWRTTLTVTVGELRRVAPTRPVSPERTRWEGLRLARAVTLTLPLLPTESRCLMRSLVLLRLMARRGLDGALVIGVDPEGGFSAHAWVEQEGKPLLTPGDYVSRRLVEL